MINCQCKRLFLESCSPEAREFLEYVLKSHGPVIFDQILAELVYRFSVEGTVCLLTQPAAFKQLVEDIRKAIVH